MEALCDQLSKNKPIFGFARVHGISSDNGKWPNSISSAFCHHVSSRCGHGGNHPPHSRWLMTTLTNEEIHRYLRHFSLDEIQLKGQEKLKLSKVLCIGAGGLGSPVLMYLAAAGIGTIGIVENDVVDTTNLQRQILFNEADVGKPKIESARDKLQAMNSTPENSSSS
jgi:hypothetical protein